MSQVFEPGTIIDEKYRIEREVGAGGMGFVVLAMHLRMEERVAIKMLHPDALRDAEAVSRFAKEAKAAARIKSEHVARVLDVATLQEGTPYIVMEYLEGSDLEQIVDAKGPLSIADAVDYVLQACEALAEAHARGIIHRDLKPGNLHLSNRSDGSPLVKVLDFGISKIATRDNDGSVTTTSALLGSPLYMSPEQMKATRDVDARSDIWAMGVVLYELLTARSPFSAPSMPQVCARVLDTDPDPFPDTTLPEGLCAAVFKCLEKKPDDRFEDVSALARALQPYAPERSMICVERIEKVIESPPTNTSMHLCRAASRSAPTIDEADLPPLKLVATQPLPMARVGSETMANATISAAYLSHGARRTTVAYGAGGFAFMVALAYLVHAHGAANAQPASALDNTSTRVAAAEQVTAPNAEPASAANRSVPANPAATTFVAVSVPASAKPDESQPATPPSGDHAATPAASSRPHRKVQEMSKYFGGRD